MAKNLEKASNTLGSLASIMTLLERYPTLTTTDSLLTNFSANASVGLLMSIIEILGVTQEDLVNWLANLLNGNADGENGFLNTIEYAVKVVLIANLKDLFTCAVDPIIPDTLMKYVNQDGRPDPCDLIKSASTKNYKEIVLDLNKIDLFGTLNNNPISKNGSIFYFDAYDSIYGDNTKSPYLKPSETWKSCDFNTYLWYIVNKGSLANTTEREMSTWDNRVSLIKYNANNPDFREKFFDITNVTGDTPNYDEKIFLINQSDGAVKEKKQFILCEFNEHVTPVTSEETLLAPSSNSLRVWINANRYYHTRKVTIKVPDGEHPGQFVDKDIEFNKTILEFNHDYIISLKIFETKTLIAQIVNSLLGLSASLSASVSVQQQMVAAKVGEIVRKVIQQDEQLSSDCYYSFSNDEYDSMLNDSLNKYNGRFQNSNGDLIKVDTSEIVDALSDIKQTGTLNVQTTQVAKTIDKILSATTAAQASTFDYVQASFGYGFIYDFLQQTITQIVLQILGPKVAIVYAINSAILGEVDSITGWEQFIQKFQNVIINIIKTVKDLLVEQLYKFVIEELKPILELLISKLALETIKYYKELLDQLIFNCIPIFNPFTSKYSVIDNVDYADIIPQQDKPETKIC